MPIEDSPDRSSPPADPADLARVRLVLTRELETISQYELLAREATSPELRTFFLHLAREEKEHVAEATAMLRKLDPDQEAHFGKPYTAEHFAGTSAPAAPSAPTEELRVPADPHKVLHSLPAPGLSGSSLTVGPLKRRDR